MKERMRLGLKFVLIGFELVLVLSLISCMAKSITSEPTLVLPGTSLPSRIPTLIDPTVTYNPTSTAIPSTLIPPWSTENPPSMPGGRVLFVRDSTINDVNSNGLVLLNTETNESSLVVNKHQELNSQTILLSYTNISWSPDGHWIAFVGTDIGKDIRLYAQEDIYIVRSDGTDLRRFTNSPHYNKWDIEWSPDGRYILVAMGINGSDLYLIDSVNGEIVERLTAGGNNYVAVWSSYGDKLAYLENSALFLMNVADKTSQQIDVPTNHHLLGISWSPDDEQIAFVSSLNDTRCADIFVIDVKTGEITNLTSSEYYESVLDWLPDGNHLVFLRSVVTCDEMGGKRDWDMYLTNLVGEAQKIVSSTATETIIAWAPVPNLEIGKQYRITELGAFLNLRAEPSLDAKILEKLPAGEVVAVLDGYVDADDYYWWKIRTQENTEGWAVEVANWYKPLNQ